MTHSKVNLTSDVGCAFVATREPVGDNTLSQLAQVWTRAGLADDPKFIYDFDH